MARRRPSRLELRRSVEDREAKEPTPRPMPEFATTNPALADWCARIWDAGRNDLQSLCQQLKAAQVATDEELRAAIRTYPTKGYEDEFRSGQVLWEVFQDRSLLDEVILRYATEDTEDELTDLLDAYPEGKGFLERLLIEIAVECPNYVRDYIENGRMEIISELLELGEAGEKLVVEMMRYDEVSDFFDGVLWRVVADSYKFDDESPIVEYCRELRTKPHGWVLAGCALWKATQRVDRRWLKRLVTRDADSMDWADEYALVVSVLAELLHDQPLASEALVQLTQQAERGFEQLSLDTVTVVGERGLRGWSTLARMALVSRSDARQVILEYATGSCQTAQGFLPIARATLESNRKTIASEPPHFERDAIKEIIVACKVIQAAGPAGKSLAPELIALLKVTPLEDSDANAVIFACLDALAGVEAHDLVTLGSLRTKLVNWLEMHGQKSLVCRHVAIVLHRLDPMAVVRELSRPHPDTQLCELVATIYPHLDLPPEVRAANVRRFAELLLHPSPEVAQHAAAMLTHHRDEATRLTPWLVAACCSMNDQLVERVGKLLDDFRARERVVVSLMSRMGGTNSTIALAAAAALWNLGEYRPIFEMLMREHAEPGGGLSAAFLDWHLQQKRQFSAVCSTLQTSLRDWIDQDPKRQRFMNQLSGLWLEPQLEALWRAMHSPDGDRSAAISRARELLPGSEDRLTGLVRLILGSTAGPAYISDFGSLLPVKYFITRDKISIADGKARRDVVYELLNQPASIERSQALIAAIFDDVKTIHPDAQALLTHSISWFRWVGLTLLDWYHLPAETLRAEVEPYLTDLSEMVREKARELLTPNT